MCGILDKSAAVLAGDLDQSRSLARMAVQMDRHNGCQPLPGAQLSGSAGHLDGIDVECIRLDIHQHGSGTHMFDDVHA